MTWTEIFEKLIEKPALATALFGLLLPVLILWMTNRHQREMKKLDIDLANENKEKSQMNDHEDMAYGALVRVLFDVQMLHVELSKSQCDEQCLEKAILEFQAKLKDNQLEIATHQLKLDSLLIDQIYMFYNIVSELIIHLSEIESIDTNMAKACVASKASDLADCMVNYQRIVYSARGISKLREMPNFRKCCGANVTDSDIQLYLDTFDLDAVRNRQLEQQDGRRTSQ